MSRSCYYLLHEDQWNRLSDAYNLVGMCQSLLTNQAEDSGLQLNTGELQGLLAVLEDRMALLPKLPTTFLDLSSAA